MDRTGIFGLFNLDGAPFDPIAARKLGLAARACSESAVGATVDLADPGAALAEHAGGRVTLFLGRIDEPRKVANRVGLSDDAPQLELARAALSRFGPDIRTILTGEWTLVHWNGRALVLVTSLVLRDPLFYAVRGNRIAIGPDLRQISQIDWVGDDLDPSGLLIAMAHEWLRTAIGPATLVRDVRSLQAGAYITIDREGVRVAAAPTVPPAQAWSGTLADAMAEAEALMLSIVRQRMVGDSYACLLSGGLDSSTLGWLLARNLRADEKLNFLTSAAAPGSDQIDEFDQAAIVAAHLGAPHYPAIPGPTPGLYRPSHDHFRNRNGPVLGSRHYLYDRFAEMTRMLGASLLFDGMFGEMTFTYPLPLRGEGRTVRAVLRQLRAQWREPRLSGPGAHFHVHLAPHILAQFPTDIDEAMRRPRQQDWLPSRRDLWGFSPMMARSARVPAVMDLGRVRLVMPFRDPRLTALFAGFPAKMLYPEPGARTPARQLLMGKLPESIRLRDKGPGIAPDYADRLRSEAAETRTRIPLYRKAGADAWIDLHALDRGLQCNAAATPGAEVAQAQLTAMAGEFFLWWRNIS